MASEHIAGTPGRRWRWESLAGGAILQEDGFRRLWLGRLCSHTGLNAVLYTLLVLAVGDGGGASLKSALFITAYLLPTATLGTISGVLVDRLPKNVVLAAINLARVGFMLVLIMSSTTNLWTVYGVALLVAVTSQFAAPAEASALPQVVEPRQLTSANSASNFGGLISQVVGFAVLAPLFLNTVGPRPLFFAASILFAAAAGFFLIMQTFSDKDVDLDSTVDAARDVRNQFAEAWQRLTHDMPSYMAVIITVLASTASLVAVTLMPRFTEDVLDIPVQNAIFVFAPAAVGILAGLRLVQLLERRVRRSQLVGAGFVLVVASFFMLSLVVPLGAVLSGATPIGETAARIVVTIAISSGAAFSYSVVGVSGRSLVHERIPHEFQGRVFAAQVVLANLASIPPILLAGFLSTLLGPQIVLAATMIVLSAVALWAVAQASLRSTTYANA
jgi:Na+/melibiose symporter-like transporter